jgi:predicted MFS family arabinose efflux permease
LPGREHAAAVAGAVDLPARVRHLNDVAARMALSRGLVRLLAAACAVTIANVYYAQPLLHTIAHGFSVSQSAAGLVVTATQAGFAAGLLLIVPLGDIAARRPLFTALLVADAAALAASAAAPALPVLAAAAVFVGTTTVVVQMIIPYAATLASDSQRTAVIGTLIGGLLLGVLGSRAFAGLVASAAGWRGVYATAAGLMTVMALVMHRMMPVGSREADSGYLAQLRATARLALAEPVLRWRSVIGAAQFAAFSCFWTTVTFLLSGPPFHFSQAGIGLFALVGAAGAGCALAGGRQLGRRPHLRWPVTGTGIIVLLGSFGLLAAGAHGLAWLITGALVMDASSQAVHVTNQAVIYDLTDSARSRITTVYMTTYFAGGALGTATGATAYDRYGWGGACAVAAGFCGIALLGWLAARHHEHPAPQRAPATR